MRPQPHRECPALRGLTTTFRSTVCRHRDCADTRLRSSPSSGRPAAPATPSPKGYTKIKACCAVVGRAVSHPQNAYCAHLRGQYQQPHPVGKASTVPFGHIFPEASPIRLLPTKPPLSWFLQKESSIPASPMLVGNAASQGARPRSCGRTLCLSTTPPSGRATASSNFSIAQGKSRFSALTASSIR
ncbi:MAG: hypothetical protein K6G25_05180 [Bacteroidales bacterium]|nr:hypothetical protein [Bacteroidales bacterium]